MNELFLTNMTEETFIDHLRQSLNKCTSFSFSVSFIKYAGFILIQKEIENALIRGAKGRIITSTYQNFTDIPTLEYFLKLQEKYSGFECHLESSNFNDAGFHSKGYLFEFDGSYEFMVGSTNITRFALLKNIEWNVALSRNKEAKIIKDAINEFGYLWNQTNPLSQASIDSYKMELEYAIEKWDMDYDSTYFSKMIHPNQMQKKALKELRRYRDMGYNRALIVAATGSGKTYLAAFDARNFDAKRLLFIVHRDTILLEAKKAFQNVFMSKRTYGIYTGNEQNIDVDFIFTTNTMLSTHLDIFDKKEFDYIIFDECHHITASTYQKIYQYFEPEFLLGLTATPERMDNEDVFSMFDRNVPFELRLRDAIKNDLVVPFKYFGIRDTMVDYSDKEKSKFLSQYFEDEHCEFISEQIQKHKPAGKLKAIAFCRNVEHARMMNNKMTDLGYATAVLTGINSTGERIKAFNDLQDDNNPLEIIFTIDLLNEGVDIPGVNTVIFLRPTESQTIFIQQLGRGLRKVDGKDYLTVLDFIGNSYDRSVQVAIALGTLSSTTYLEKPLLTSLVTDNFSSLGLDGVEINFDEKSKEEILKYIESTNFNRFTFLEEDYKSFKHYLNPNKYPSHLDYLNCDCAPDLMRFIKSRIRGKKTFSYYNFLKQLNEDIPLFNLEETKLLELISDQLPLTRREEYLILQSILLKTNDDLTKISPRITSYSLQTAINNLIKQKILDTSGLKLNLSQPFSNGFEEHLIDLLSYGLARYDIEFGEFEGQFKEYANYQKDKIMLELDGNQYAYMLGTKHDVENQVTYVFIGLKKDKSSKEDFQYKDKFLSPKVFQWESVNNTTRDNPEGRKLLNSKTIHLFVRKMDEEDGISLPFTYFGTGHFENCRESENNGKPTLLFDIVLDHEVPVEYRYDFQVPEEVQG